MALTAEGAQTRLKYNARATVGGKMAQIGSRLIDATAAKITEDFFKAFEANLQASSAPAADAADAPVVATPAATGVGKVWWLIGAVVLLAVVYFVIRK